MSYVAGVYTNAGQFDSLDLGTIWNSLTGGGANANLKVGGYTKVAVVPITTTNGTAYASGDNIGGILSIANAVRNTAGTGFICDLQIVDINNQRPTVEIDFFTSSPTGTYTNDAAQSFATADALLYLGKVNVATADYTTQSGGSALVGIASKTLQNIPFVCAATTLFFTIRTTSVVTYSTAQSLIVKIGISQD